MVEPEGANVVEGQKIADKPDRGSVMLIDVNVTLPVFVTASENVCTSPNDAPVGAVSVVMATDFDNAIVFV